MAWLMIKDSATTVLIYVSYKLRTCCFQHTCIICSVILKALVSWYHFCSCTFILITMGGLLFVKKYFDQNVNLNQRLDPIMILCY